MHVNEEPTERTLALVAIFGQMYAVLETKLRNEMIRMSHRLT